MSYKCINYRRIVSSFETTPDAYFQFTFIYNNLNYVGSFTVNSKPFITIALWYIIYNTYSSGSKQLQDKKH